MDNAFAISTSFIHGQFFGNHRHTHTGAHTRKKCTRKNQNIQRSLNALSGAYFHFFSADCFVCGLRLPVSWVRNNWFSRKFHFNKTAARNRVAPNAIFVADHGISRKNTLEAADAHQTTANYGSNGGRMRLFKLRFASDFSVCALWCVGHDSGVQN